MLHYESGMHAENLDNSRRAEQHGLRGLVSCGDQGQPHWTSSSSSRLPSALARATTKTAAFSSASRCASARAALIFAATACRNARSVRRQAIKRLAVERISPAAEACCCRRLRTRRCERDKYQLIDSVCVCEAAVMGSQRELQAFGAPFDSSCARPRRRCCCRCCCCRRRRRRRHWHRPRRWPPALSRAPPRRRCCSHGRAYPPCGCGCGTRWQDRKCRYRAT